MNYVGRLAPSPTGAQHVGNARSFLVAWLKCRMVGGKLLLRIEDLDTPRTKTGATEQAIEDLHWLGLDWDELGHGKSYATQSNREDRYVEVLELLKQRELVYPCSCTRSEIDRVSSAPHESTLDGAIYPGTCTSRSVHDALEMQGQGKSFAWRFRMPAGLRSFFDEGLGLQCLDAKRSLGDFIVARSYAATAYQLAVVVDDHDFGITHVVRGNDLVFSTYRQIALYEALQWTSPQWHHLPLVVGADGKRLAKRHGDSRLSVFRKQGVAPETIIGYLAKTLGLIRQNDPMSALQLLQVAKQTPDWLRHIPIDNVVFSGFFD